MVLVNWGQLAKSQADAELIEEAINRIIADHNNDPEAHIEEGQSLQSHKASAIIDHLAASIINDKLENLSVTPNKLNFNIIYCNPPLESIDAYNQVISGAGGSVALESFGKVALIPGPTVGNYVSMNVDNSSIAFYTEKDPFFQCWVADSDDRVSDIGVSMGLESPFDTNNGGFGIEWIKSTDIVRGFYNTYYSGLWHREVVTLHSGVPINEIWRAEFDHVNKKIYFYINNVLTQTLDISAHYYEDDDDFYISIGSKKQQTYTGSATFFMNLIWGQNL